MNQPTSAVRPNCRTCGLPIEDSSYVTWNGVAFHNDHVPRQEPTWMTKEEIGRKVMETTLTLSEGYTRAISENFMTLAERQANEKCAIAVNNAGYFILQSLGFKKQEILALRDNQQLPEK